MTTARLMALGIFAAVVVIRALTVSYADYLSYVEGVQRVLQTGSPYAGFQISGPYLLGDAAAGRGFVYPPTSLWPLMLFTFDLVGGLMLNVAGAILYAAVLLAIVERRVRLGWWAVPLLVLFGVSPPMQNAITLGQVTPWLGAMVGAAWLVPRLSGWLAVVGGLVKVYPALGLVWTLRKREPIVAPLIAGAVIAGFTAIVWPAAWPGFVVSSLNGEAGCYPWALPSFACVLPGGQIVGVIAVSFLAVLAYRLRSDEIAYAVLGCAMIVAAPDLYLNYLLIPMMALMPWVADQCARTISSRSVSTRELLTE